MPVKTPTNTKVLILRNLTFADHWRLETYARSKKLGKMKAAAKIIREALKSVKLELEPEEA